MRSNIRRLLWNINQSRCFKNILPYLRPFTPRISLCPDLKNPKNSADPFRIISEFKNMAGDMRGRIVLVHSSIDGLGMDMGSVPALIDRCIDWVGEKGTVLMPVFSYSLGQRRLRGEQAGFEVEQTPAETGVIPEMFRRKTGVRRSLHPTHSVASYGYHADAVIAHHHEDIRPFGEQSPFYELVRMQGLIIGLGVDWYRCLTSVHTAEDLMKDEFGVSAYWKDPVTIEVVGSQDRRLQVKTLVHDNRVYQYMNLLKLRKCLVVEGAIWEYEIDKTPLFIADACKLNEVVMQMARYGKTIYS